MAMNIDRRLFYLDRKAVNRKPFRKRWPKLYWCYDNWFLIVQFLIIAYCLFFIYDCFKQYHAP